MRGERLALFTFLCTAVRLRKQCCLRLSKLEFGIELTFWSDEPETGRAAILPLVRKPILS
jgi:hypothetical protein